MTEFDPRLTVPISWPTDRFTLLTGRSLHSSRNQNCYAIGLILIQFLAGSLLSVLVGYLLFGLSIAIFQWPVLRREIPNAIPWVLANIVGWALGAYLSQFFLNLVYTGSAINPLLSTGVLSGLTGLIAGAITGLAFVWIVRKPERAYDLPTSKPS